MAEWTPDLPWQPHEKALAQWAARRWSASGDWPAGLALLAAAEDEGHTALDWNRAEEVWNRRFAAEEPVPAFTVPPPETWPSELFRGWLVREGSLIQTVRHRELERRLARTLSGLASGNAAFSPETGQDAAVARAGRTRLLILAGGPGTGKTTTLKRLAAAWAERRPGTRAVVAAPTGRAAARAGEAFGGTVPTLTVHRLLGLRPGLGSPRHGPERPLPFDLVIVDEASMLDLRTAAALTDALDQQAALVLVGDPGQLPSVEAGSVLSSLLARPEFAASTVRLTARYRLAGPSLALAGVFDLLASPPDSGDLDRLRALAETASDFRWEITGEDEDPGRKALAAWGNGPVSLEALNDAVLLSPVHDGAGGTRELCALADRARGRQPGTPGDGLPWMITRNLPHLGLSNGDRGLIARRDGALWFSVPEGRPWPFALVAHDGQPAWAVTVHKSQGSEFGRVVLALPPRDSPVIGRELLYTGLTRARESAVLVASVEAVRRALGRKLERMSGLA